MLEKSVLGESENYCLGSGDKKYCNSGYKVCSVHQYIYGLKNALKFALFLASDNILSLHGDVSVHFIYFASTCTSTCSVDVNFTSFALSVCSHLFSFFSCHILKRWWFMRLFLL